MKKLVACIAVAAVSLAAAGTAEANPPAKGVISLYDVYVPTNESSALPFGQLLSTKACEGNRKFKLVGVNGSKSTTIDKGKTSRDGGLSAIVHGRDSADFTDVVFIVAKTKACAQATFSFRKMSKEVAEKAAAKAANSIVQFLDVASRGTDGMFAGTVESPSHECASNRKIKLLLGDKVLDTTTTTASRTWALHITKAESKMPGKIRAVVEKGSECAGGKDTFE